MDVAHALASDLSFGSGLLPPDTLWWQIPGWPGVRALREPKIWKLALQEDIKKPPQRFTIPLPRADLSLHAGQAPWVYAVKKRPAKETDVVYRAPLANIFNNGRSCPAVINIPPGLVM